MTWGLALFALGIFLWRRPVFPARALAPFFALAAFVLPALTLALPSLPAPATGSLPPPTGVSPAMAPALPGVSPSAQAAESDRGDNRTDD